MNRFIRFLFCVAFGAFWVLIPATFVAGLPQEPLAEKENHLAGETSPYLLSHVHNPVDWYPWGEAALKRARDENKMIFLSIGYSSCHWCHVMERESFTDREIAQFLNENFVCIKVDREERPDVDRIYMESLLTFNQMNGSNRGGGWPLSMFLLPDARPFFGGSYFPARDGDRKNTPGFLTIIKRVHEVWKSKADALTADAEALTTATRRQLSRVATASKPLSEEQIDEAVEHLFQAFDPDHGGFGFSSKQNEIPKFPQPPRMIFLLGELRRQPDDARLKAMVDVTCRELMNGGIYDHVAGGWHRYSTDRFWRVPHFEKMLYDNAQLITLFSHWWEMGGNPQAQRIVEKSIGFVERELAAPAGGFYTALDADSEGKEGSFYVWSRNEVEQVLGDELFPTAELLFGLDGPANFEDGKFVLVRTSSLEAIAAKLAIASQTLPDRIGQIESKLLAARSTRKRPATDTKILSADNGLMIRALADAGRIFKNPSFIALAEKTASFVIDNMVDNKGHLFRTHTDGVAKIDAYLDDYCLFIDGLIGLHQATGKTQWLDAARRFQKIQDERFWDSEGHGYFFSARGNAELIAQIKDTADNVMPAGNNVAVGNLLYLAKQGNEPAWNEMAKQTARAAAPTLEDFPEAAPRLLSVFREVLADNGK